MDQPLIRFEEGFFDDVLYGVNDAQVIGVFDGALEHARQTVQKSVRDHANQSPDWKALANKLSVQWTDGGLMIDYPDDIAEEVDGLEFGRPDVIMQPVIRPSLNAVVYQVARDIQKETLL